MKEAEIQKYCLDSIRKIGVFCMRINSGKVKVRGGFMQLAPVGTADIVVYPEGKLPCWLEIKQASGEQRLAQIAFQEKVTSLGHSYHVIKSINEVMALLPKLR